jgi:hypothetical protein
VRGEELPTEATHGDQAPGALAAVTLDEAPLVGVFPHRKTGTGSPPRIHDIGIPLPEWTEPFEEIEDQGVDRVGHGGRNVIERSTCRKGVPELPGSS